MRDMAKVDFPADRIFSQTVRLPLSIHLVLRVKPINCWNVIS